MLSCGLHTLLAMPCNATMDVTYIQHGTEVPFLMSSNIKTNTKQPQGLSMQGLGHPSIFFTDLVLQTTDQTFEAFIVML